MALQRSINSIQLLVKTPAATADITFLEFRLPRNFKGTAHVAGLAFANVNSAAEVFTNKGLDWTG